MDDNTQNELKNEDSGIKEVKFREMPKRDKLQEVIPFLFYYEPFFADVFRYINKTKSLELPIAGVRVTSEAEVELLYNPVTFNSMNLTEIYFVIKHEIYHVLLSHIFQRAKTPHRLWNVVNDSIINNMVLKDLHNLVSNLGKSDAKFVDIKLQDINDGEFGILKRLIFPHTLKEEFLRIARRYPDYYSEETIIFDGSSEQIFDLFLKFLPKEEDTEINPELDTHFSPDESGSDGGEKEGEGLSDVKAEIAKEKFKKQVEEIVKEARSRNYGNVPVNIMHIINELLASKTVDWRILLSYFIKQTIRGHKYNSIRKINKRYPYIHSGQKHKKYARVLVGVDESGSMSNELIKELFAEIKGLAELVQFDVISFDTEVDLDSRFTWKKGIKLNKYTRRRYGGTDFNPVSQYAVDNKYDGLILVTDCQAPFPRVNKIRRLWLTDKENIKYCNWKNKEMVISTNKKS